MTQDTHAPMGDAFILSFALFHPDYTVGPGITPGLLTPIQTDRPLAGFQAFARFTAGGELNPALRTILKLTLGKALIKALYSAASVSSSHFTGRSACSFFSSSAKRNESSSA